MVPKTNDFSMLPKMNRTRMKLNKITNSGITIFSSGILVFGFYDIVVLLKGRINTETDYLFVALYIVCLIFLISRFLLWFFKT